MAKDLPQPDAAARMGLDRRQMMMASSALVALGLPSRLVGSAQAQPAAGGTQAKPATAATKAANDAVRNALNFNDRDDFENATRGLIARPDTLTIRDAKGGVVWDLEAYKSFIAVDRPAPDTVNPSLWRNAQLCMQYGLFRVHDRIFQVRGHDLANVTFVQGDTGWIVLDTGSNLETGKAALELVSQHLGRRPVHAVVYSHSHGDHYGGVRGLVEEADVRAGKVQIIAPVGFTEHAISEFVIAGNAMARRGVYMYGPLLPRNVQGGVNAGLGQTVGHGNGGLLVPTREITRTGEELTIDGVRLVFQMTPGTEAPAEMNTYFPQFRAMWMAENTTNTMHNLLTLRGAVVRDGLAWAKFINETIELYGDATDVKFQAHHWPMWGNAKIIDYWKKQRDLYKYIHDQSVHLMNKGYTGVEISNMIRLPPELDRAWFNRGYYGSLKHNSRAVYQRYMGFYDGNPSTLDQLPPEEAARKYVEYMGGAAAILQNARADFERGEYRWVAEALKHVVFADASNRDAREVLADAYEQMGYQAESGPWRSIYLQGALELRRGVPSAGELNTSGPDTVRAMPPEMTFDYLAVKLNAERAAGKALSLTIEFSDLNQAYALLVENSVLNYTKKPTTTEAKLTLTKETFDQVQAGELPVDQAMSSGAIRVDGRRDAVREFVGLFDNFPFWFNIITP
ncbi:alkyl/aryl-sulfatase [Paracraurococcus lichenis]|uniref:Alkyl sulfatase dimerization domain-containing protein n=1 Tax=Paracraurococcus lichenis TaxID=3064888 RepID=A0ABT9EDA3_9PROT|nr:alkyl sulfatase dimerization domain-containing protein [Paracraurococcus sp. LOR1-02]MDO9714089.1 alkyl sulfatase dimerization domain-containing protein [Paracraurococcus sp. LOR1-02]